MHVRSTTLDVEPGRVDLAVALVREQLLPLVATLEGSFGLSMEVDRVTGRTVTRTMWGTATQQAASLRVLAPLRDDLAVRLGARPVVEHWEVAELYRAARPRPGDASRSTRLEFDLGDAEQLVDVVRTTTVPSLALLDGFVSAALLVDLDTATGLMLVTFTDRQALQDSRRASAEIRRTTVDKAHARATEVVEADLVIAEVHVPDQA